ncbi:RagB/SusD family nutrient uptake outer membrane protein [Marinigracilibium pacificum]|uniref:RagB/SusD family nutrient uptake outer membrane protein n=1 Tax=Marinigracilibium pacificum TaxID=2729599 RepID=A0A848IZG3_9BACT|nr:RagB/SusD family nutrient uptake outer membrane protein [Marinigracilibium pacificum]NMM48538.1 RagB/SusD family nutrient uptake outer membrane protein [Marinigracilibium pacificum]
MKLINKITIIVFVSLIIATGCDDYVDIGPKGTQDADNFFISPEDYEQALTGAYDLLQTSYLSVWIGEIASDNSLAGGESATDTEGLHQIDDMTHGGVNAELRNIMRWNYAGITRANYIFENKDNIDFEGKDEILAQAHFLRAYYYFELVKFFGDMPLILDRRIGIDEVSTIPRTPATEIYAQIEADLQAAADVLPWTNATKGRVTKGSALGLLGRVYTYQKKYDEAATVLQTIIDAGIYSLFPDYTTMFYVENEGNEEVLFDIEYVGIEGGSYGCFVCLEGFAAPGFHGIRQYEGPFYGDGNSYNVPTADLYNSFDPNDIRRDASVLDIVAWANSNDGVNYAEGYQHTGYFNNKYIKRANELGAPDNDLTSPLNHIIVRYADVLLMAAEANALKSSPDESLAQQYLNEVRDRVGLSPVSASGSDLVDAIFNERRWEFAGEGLRFFDLLRSGDAEQEIEGFVVGKHELFPIPQVEIDLSGAGWPQNPNY